MRNIILATILAATGAAHADVQEDYCAGGAQLAHSLSMAYQRGVSESVLLAALEDSSLAPEHVALYQDAVRMLYKARVPIGNTPEERGIKSDAYAVGFYTACMKAFQQASVPTTGDTI